MGYNLKGKKAVITGGAGAIGSEIVRALSAEEVDIAVWDLDAKAVEKLTAELSDAPSRVIGIPCDSTDPSSVGSAMEQTVGELGTVDILVNGVGGSRKTTTTSETLTFFDIDPGDMRDVISLNYTSTVYASQRAGRIFASRGEGVIVNIASIAGLLPLTRALTYSDSKAAVVSFTRWLAVHMATEYSPRIRVNAVAPGFILTEQNRFLLQDGETGGLTARGKQVVAQTPMGRLGSAGEITGVVLWLVSDSASFVTGAVIPVDGGFSAFSGV